VRLIEHTVFDLLVVADHSELIYRSANREREGHADGFASRVPRIRMFHEEAAVLDGT